MWTLLSFRHKKRIIKINRKSPTGLEGIRTYPVFRIISLPFARLSFVETCGPRWQRAKFGSILRNRLQALAYGRTNSSSFGASGLCHLHGLKKKRDMMDVSKCSLGWGQVLLMCSARVRLDPSVWTERPFNKIIISLPALCLWAFMEMIISTHWIVFFNWLREILHLQYADHVCDATIICILYFCTLSFHVKKKTKNKKGAPIKLPFIVQFIPKCELFYNTVNSASPQENSWPQTKG